MNEEKPKLEWYVSGVGQIRYGCNPFCFSTCNSIKFEAIALKLLHKIPTFVSYKWHLFKALQECHKPCVLTLNTLHFFFTICPNIWVGCNTCWGDRQKLDKRNKKGVHTREHASKKGFIGIQEESRFVFLWLIIMFSVTLIMLLFLWVTWFGVWLRTLKTKCQNTNHVLSETGVLRFMCAILCLFSTE